jgi:hypothetical protein
MLQISFRVQNKIKMECVKMVNNLLNSVLGNIKTAKSAKKIGVFRQEEAVLITRAAKAQGQASTVPVEDIVAYERPMFDKKTGEARFDKQGNVRTAAPKTLVAFAGAVFASMTSIMLDNANETLAVPEYAAVDKINMAEGKRKADEIAAFEAPIVQASKARYDLEVARQELADAEAAEAAKKAAAERQARADAEAAELARLRARVAELEALPVQGEEIKGKGRKKDLVLA